MPFTDRFRFLLRLLSERLWIRPLGFSLLALFLLGAASATDRIDAPGWLPDVPYQTVEQLLSIIATTMLAVATFAVASMVSAYAAASSTATPRAFRLIVADQSSQNALSTFVGAFIYSVLALVATKMHEYGGTGLFSVFVVTLVVFAWVILTFVRWVDDIARLGRMGNTLTRVEKAARRAFAERGPRGALGGVPISPDDAPGGGDAVYADEIGYVQHVDMPALQRFAEEHDVRLTVDAVPGCFVTARRPLARVHGAPAGVGTRAIVEAFLVKENRSFVQDPRFGLIVLSETASRALSTGVNDPGTAIDVLGRAARVLADVAEDRAQAPEEGAQEGAGPEAPEPARFDRVHVEPLRPADLFDDAFSAIARDGAALREVGLWLMKALASLADLGDEDFAAEARRHATLALARAEAVMALPEDVQALREAARPLTDGAR